MIKKVVVALLAIIALATPALAAQPVRTLTLNPASPHFDEAVYFSGCGYGANKDIGIFVEAPGSEVETFKIGTRADSTGCFITNLPVYFRTSQGEAGEWEAYVYFKHGSGVSDYGNGKAVLEQEFDVLA